MAVKDGKIRLSPSALNLYLECSRCFWAEQINGIHRPKGPFPSLPGGMDLLIKKYFDKYRNVGKMPPEIEGKIEGQLLADLELLKKWRNWRTGLTYQDKETGAVLVGALDDCAVENGKYIPVDYKTRGFDVKEGGESFYQNQLNCYSLLLEVNDLPQPGFAYLVYYIPKDVSEGGMVRFQIDVKKVKTDSEEGLRVFKAAVNTLKSPMPESHSACGFCSWGNDFLT